GGQLWMLDLDSMQYFNSKIEEEFTGGAKQKTVQAGDTVSVYYRPETDTLIGIDSAHFVVRFDSDALGFRDYTLPPGWKVLNSYKSAGTLDLWLIGDTTATLPNPMLRVAFNTYLALSAKVYLDSAHLYGHRLNCDCQALSIANPDSVEVDFTGCGDSTLLHFMQTGSPFTIESIVPNPAQTEITVQLGGAAVGTHHAGSAITYTLSDALGRGALSGEDIPTSLNVSGLPSGVYYLRLSQNGFTETRRVVIER
ncbi:MAG TPA: T9SS type A sorting domain-containing protein, partial [Candidatus Kapabacteria bacterium]|nr:T9SS type A sorting domain-containing protein [Candidatus Kapabacteria bacterium]